ncbi:MAG: CAP domain-containing protein [Deltaproteobacteria bacterium]
MRPPSFAIVIVLVTACGGDDGTTGDQDAQQFCVSETNRYRAMNGKADLSEAANLEDYADTGAMTDYDANSPHSHFSSTQGGGIAFAENECPGHSGWHLAPGGDLNALVGMCIAAFYSEGPGTDYSTHGHYINMMGDYAKLGCGIFSADNGDVTIVQDYGN